MQQEIRKRLMAEGEPDYAIFSKGLIPDCKPLIGVRLPRLRSIAKEMVKGDWRAQLDTEDEYFEEVMLRGMLIGYGSSKDGDVDEALQLIDDFIPHVDNWSICDCCCVSFDIFEKNRSKVWEHIQKYIYSEKEFEERVGIIILLDHFLKVDDAGKKIKRLRTVTMQETQMEKMQQPSNLYLEKILDCINRPITQGYYASMAVSWLIAESFVAYPGRTYTFLQKNQLDDITYNKALQKIIESRIPTDEVKNCIRGMKRRKSKDEEVTMKK